MVSDETNAEGVELTTNAAQQLAAPEGTAEPAAEQPEPQAVTAQEPAKPVPTVEELAKQLADRESKIAVLEANHKAMQRNLEAARRTGTLDPETKKILEELQENQALLLDEVDYLKSGRETEEFLTQREPQAPRKSRLEALRESKAAKTSEQQRVENARLNMVRMLSVSGIDPETAAKHTDAARVAFESGKYEEAVDLFGRGLAQARKAPANTPPVLTEKDIEERANLRALQMMKERGLLDTDLGGPSSGSSGSMEEIEDKFIRGQISASEYEKALNKQGG